MRFICLVICCLWISDNLISMNDSKISIFRLPNIFRRMKTNHFWISFPKIAPIFRMIKKKTFFLTNCTFPTDALKVKVTSVRIRHYSFRSNSYVQIVWRHILLVPSVWCNHKSSAPTIHERSAQLTFCCF